MKLHEHQLEFNEKFEFTSDSMDLEKLQFRMLLGLEEAAELEEAVHAQDASEIVDALVDQIYIAYGTLNMLGVDITDAFLRVHMANMQKQRGPKLGRSSEAPNMYDVFKPKGWIAPDHTSNIGILDKLLEK